MIAKRIHTPGTRLRSEPKIGWFAFFSLVLHLMVGLLFSGVFAHKPVREHRPVYFVDLSRLPVANPQAGRPDGSPKPAPKEAAKTAPAPAPKPAQPPTPVAAAKPVPVKPKKPAETVKPAQAPPKTEKKPASKTATAAAKPEKKPDAKPETGKSDVDSNYQKTLDNMKNMQAKAEREALKEKLAALAAMDTRNAAGDSGSDAPLGMQDGTGTEAGVSQELWLQTWLKENWSFSRYQASRNDLEALTRITYDAEGKLIDYQFSKKSGDGNFDDSVTKAILKGRQLPFKPGRRLDVTVIFNLKDLME
jgi:colicin import membrane protein